MRPSGDLDDCRHGSSTCEMPFQSGLTGVADWSWREERQEAKVTPWVLGAHSAVYREECEEEAEHTGTEYRACSRMAWDPVLQGHTPYLQLGRFLYFLCLHFLLYQMALAGLQVGALFLCLQCLLHVDILTYQFSISSQFTSFPM